MYNAFIPMCVFILFFYVALCIACAPCCIGILCACTSSVNLLVSLMCFSIHSLISHLSADCSEWQDGRVHQHPGHSFSQCCAHAHASETQRHPTGLPRYSSSHFSSIFYILNVFYFKCLVFCKSPVWQKHSVNKRYKIHCRTQQFYFKHYF